LEALVNCVGKTTVVDDMKEFVDGTTGSKNLFGWATTLYNGITLEELEENLTESVTLKKVISKYKNLHHNDIIVKVTCFWYKYLVNKDYSMASVALFDRILEVMGL